MKNIPPQLIAHLSLPATTWCYLLKIECRGAWLGTVLGFADLDTNLDYDDGLGEITYYAGNGFTPDQLQHSADISAVGNTLMHGWVTNAGITQEQILAGIFDFADVTIYRVNYMDLSLGHEVMAFGTCGETEFGGPKWSVEFRSLAQQARQTISSSYSITCRNTFGDSRCKMPFIWSPGTVSALGVTNTRELFANLSQDTGWFNGGVLEWLTGSNAGAQMEVDTYLNGVGDAELVLILPMPLAIQIGDTFRVRRDCPKTFEACKAYGNRLWFFGEHLTPISNPGVLVPGAHIERQA